MSYAAGSLVRARGRDWVVLPDSDEELVMVRPLGGADEEITGILTALEEIAPAGFELPNPSIHLGDALSAGLLRDALRLGFRSSAGPFRSVGRIAVQPRPYQLVPLLMALRLDPVRLLIADDVGVGKTIEASLIARELLECGDARKLAVLCPPHLAEQWQVELESKFHIEAELVLSSTAARLERNLAVGQSLFDVYDHFVVSLDFIKSDRRRNDFIRACPELVIVDEAHTCASSERAGRTRHQRHSLVADLAKDLGRHMILVTATPHSGKDESFRSLLGLLDDDFKYLPDNLAGEANRHHRTRLARHLVQRRRADIAHYLQADTAFPRRADAEDTYTLSADYSMLFEDVLAYARRSVRAPADGLRRQRIRWWSALSLLRALASSPAAAAATMRTRALTAEAETLDEIDELGRRTLLDLDEGEEVIDVVPGSTSSDTVPRRLREFATRADALAGEPDLKLVRLAKIVRGLLVDKFRPVVFCRFIETAEYVAAELAKRLRSPRAGVLVVTGRLPPAERHARVSELREHNYPVLVATDCLSEGINLQDYCSAVVHYDLPWNPTRLEQREGRVDRFGQPAPEVRMVTYWGEDNHIDETVLKVLLHKHKAIRKALGVSIPVPGATNEVIEALAENVLMGDGMPNQRRFDWMDEALRSHAATLDLEWDQASETEIRRRSLFAQHTIDPKGVAAELDAMRAAIGSGADAERFMKTVLGAQGAVISPERDASGQETASVFDLREVPAAVRDALVVDRDAVKACFEPPGADTTVVWSRTHPSVGGLAGHVLDTALDPVLAPEGVAARCGVMRTGHVARLTTLLVCRSRMTIETTNRQGLHHMLAEEALLLAFAGAPQSPKWLSSVKAENLLSAIPSGNVHPEAAASFVEEVLSAERNWRPHVHSEADRRAEALEDTHARVRSADRRRVGAVARGSGRGSGRVRVSAQHPTDILGLYVFLPAVVP